MPPLPQHELEQHNEKIESKLLPCDENISNKINGYRSMTLLMSVISLVGVMFHFWFAILTLPFLLLGLGAVVFMITEFIERWQQNHCSMHLDAIMTNHEHKSTTTNKGRVQHYYYLVVQYDVPIGTVQNHDSNDNKNNSDKNANNDENDNSKQKETLTCTTQHDNNNNTNNKEFLRIEKKFLVEESTYRCHREQQIVHHERDDLSNHHNLKVSLRFAKQNIKNNNKNRIEPIFTYLSSEQKNNTCEMFGAVLASMVCVGIPFLGVTSISFIFQYINDRDWVPLVTYILHVISTFACVFLLAYESMFFQHRCVVSMERIVLPTCESLPETAQEENFGSSSNHHHQQQQQEQNNDKDHSNWKEEKGIDCTTTDKSTHTEATEIEHDVSSDSSLGNKKKKNNNNKGKDHQETKMQKPPAKKGDNSFSMEIV